MYLDTIHENKRRLKPQVNHRNSNQMDNLITAIAKNYYYYCGVIFSWGFFSFGFFYYWYGMRYGWLNSGIG